MDFDGDSQAFEGFSARPRYGLVLTNGVTVREFNSYYGLTEQEAVSWPAILDQNVVRTWSKSS